MGPNVLSAGFLFYSHPPDSEDVYFLLGMDDYNYKWSDFGGRRNVNESEVDCAVREMVEETMFTVQIQDSTCTTDVSSPSPPIDPVAVHQEYVQQAKTMIETKNYTYRIGLDITPRREKQTIVSHGFDISTLSVYYVCPFTLYRSRTTPLPHALPESLKRLRVCYVKYIPWQPNLPEKFAKTYKWMYHLSTLSTLDEKIKYYNTTLPCDLRSHPALCIDRRDGKIVQISVLKEWMENQQIAWWSLPRIKYALKNGGKYKRHVLRYGFLSTLGIVLERFSQPKSSSEASGTRFVCDMDRALHMEALRQALLYTCVCGHHTTELSHPLSSIVF